MNKRGLTTIELIAVIFCLSLVVILLGQLYTLGLNIWFEGYTRHTASNQTSQSLERIVKALRQARAIDGLTENSITFKADLGNGENTYRVYLYNAADDEPNPPYTQSNYELRWAQGDLAYGDGTLLVTDIPQPTSPVFSRTNDYITIDLTRNYSDSQVRFRSNVQLRNL